MASNLDYVSGVASYFRSAQFSNFLHMLRTLEQRSHIHIFVNSTVHPESLEKVLKEYFRRIGIPTNRLNEILVGGPNQGTLHGVHPAGTPHFDMKWNFKPGTTLEPMEEWLGEQGQNLLYWGEEYMDYFRRNYQWAPVGSREIADIEAYFDSRHWHHSFELMLDPRVVHIHPHIQTNVHRNVLEGFIREALDRKGWKLQRMLQNAYHVKGIYYGKFMFLFKEPELGFDFDWVYNKDVVLAPFTGDCLLQDEPGYTIVWKKTMEEFLESRPHHVLSDSEFHDIFRAIENLPAAA